ncbi:type IV toxin-antitoxin system AbiEi family antitoxin domain-containing protein [Jiangella alkaliphila]|uniref:Transcriptional regulator, AbiEi antitoxin, Type IV TA system n=1 Tax=Jiangella alkaliphila TaxID=419479 RepID=A0A1H2LB04_9ACTN|nr:type IV toxin-antitoxin system AbiEi family antitoxin domain-containing protein [Jiangella alkaliphila]SDU77994.1 hypothetical protein SAMN04488563_5682 [Jiangella alkaliphila]
MPHERALALARVQDGLLTRQQALAAGMSAEAVRHAIRPGGPWQRVLPGVYATFSGPLSPLHRLRAAVLHAGEGALVTGPWACDLAGLRYGPPVDDNVDLLVDWARGQRGHGFVRTIRTRRMPKGQRWLDDERLSALQRCGPPLDEVLDPLAPTASPGVVPVVPVARAVADTVVRWARLPADWRPNCSRTGGCRACWDEPGHHRARALRNTRALMCEAVQRRRATLTDLRIEVGAAPRRGGALARLAMYDIEAGCRSAPECELRDLVRTSQFLPEPRWNQVLPGQRGIHPDACWERACLVVEVDSRSFHGFGDAPARTEERRARYAALGWRVLPVSPARLRTEPGAVLREIEAAYLSGHRDG